MSTNNTGSVVVDDDAPLIFNAIQFWSFLIVLIPAIVCSFFTLYQFLFNRTLRKTHNNHVIIAVLFVGLICQLTNYPWMLYYYNFEGIWERSVVFCSIWAYLDWAFYVLQTMILAWATIERHIFIFHDRWIATQKKRFIVHYLPIIILPIYCISFYVYFDFLSPCENALQNNYMRCIYLCIYDSNTFNIGETIGHQIIPCVIILVSSSTLLGRVIWKKKRMNQPVQWRKHRKMAIQLLSMTMVYLLLYFPYTFLNFLYFSGCLQDTNQHLSEFVTFLSYFMMLVLPFVCMLTLPELSKYKCVKTVLRFRQATAVVAPMTLTVIKE